MNAAHYESYSGNPKSVSQEVGQEKAWEKSKTSCETGSDTYNLQHRALLMVAMLFHAHMSMWREHMSRIILHQLTMECVGKVSKLVKSAPHCIFNFFGSLDFLPGARAGREEWTRKVWSAVVRSS